jgi:CheY-like chemotaxis protein
VPILLVEDHEAARDAIAHVLLTRGHRVVCARHTSDALAQVQAIGARPRLVVFDVSRPRIDAEFFLGAQLVEPLLRGVPVILSVVDPPRSLPPTVKELLWHPMQLGDILRAVERCLEPALAHAG